MVYLSSKWECRRVDTFHRNMEIRPENERNKNVYILILKQDTALEENYIYVHHVEKMYIIRCTLVLSSVCVTQTHRAPRVSSNNGEGVNNSS